MVDDFGSHIGDRTDELCEFLILKPWHLVLLHFVLVYLPPIDSSAEVDDANVGILSVACLDQDVLQLEVPMSDACLVHEHDG